MGALATPRRVVSGTEAIRTFEKVRSDQKNRDSWPYEWRFPPPNAKRVHQPGTLVCPTSTTQALICAYTVPANWQFWWTHLVQLYLGGAAVVPGDGSITWTIDVNIPLGVSTPNGYPVQGFAEAATTFQGIPYGLFQSGVGAPYELEMPQLLNPNDLLQSKVVVAAGIFGQGTFLTIFGGYLVPA